MAPRLHPPRAARATLLPAALLLAAWLPPARAAEPPVECTPPRTLVALSPLMDATDRTWSLWSGGDPAALVTRMLTDSLRSGRICDVISLPGAGPAPGRPLEDDVALHAARSAHAEVVVTGSVSRFTHEDRREGGKLWRWGVGAPDARSRAQVRVTLRVLDAQDGQVIIESTVSRDRAGRGTATVSRTTPGAPATPAPLLVEALGEVLADLVRTVERRLDARWQASVQSVARDTCVIAVAAARGMFAGQRLEVWRAGIETFDEDLVRLHEEARVGVLVVTELESRGRVRARLAEGEVRAGDRVRACSPGPALSLRR